MSLYWRAIQMNRPAIKFYLSSLSSPVKTWLKNLHLIKKRIPLLTAHHRPTHPRSIFHPLRMPTRKKSRALLSLSLSLSLSFLSYRTRGRKNGSRDGIESNWRVGEQFPSKADGRLREKSRASRGDSRERQRGALVPRGGNTPTNAQNLTGRRYEGWGGGEKERSN